ncbi:hypothetical protein [Oceaniovalibus guishaninsula]|uniref:hypothetical protein n=1 Tax=Oceaniovalibus guishaninsula TaxID=1046117 RepID=UPI0012EAA756|nr:hypothetical protein [Oceaniovalibus guishaninsula]
MRDRSIRLAGVLAALWAVAGLAAFAWPGVAIAAVCLSFGAAMALFQAVSGLRFPPRLTIGVVAFSAAALLGGEWADVYEAVPWWDLALHAASAWMLAAVGMALGLLATAGARPRTAVWILSILAFGFAMMVGAMWEVLEFTLDTLFGTDAQDGGNIDTMTDIVANTAGALGGVVVAHAAVASGRRVPPGGVLLDFVAMNPVIYAEWRGPLVPRQTGQTGRREARAHGAFQRGRQAGGDVIAGEEQVGP